ncbi:AMP-binding protein, partial [Nocardioides hankookensis]
MAVASTHSRAAVRAYVAVLLAGGAYVPIDASLPQERRQLLAEVARVATHLDPAGEAITTLRGGAVPVSRRSDDVAYVIHTSGSTGVPKAVQMEHRNLLTTIHGMDERAPVPDGYVGTWWASPGFDAAAWEIWSVLARGGTLVVVGAEDRLEPGRFFATLTRERVASCFLPPLFVPDFVDAVETAPERFASLRRILVGAEPIQLGLLQRAVRAADDLQIVNGYGPAEASVFCTLYDVPRSDGDPAGRAPVGTALPGVRVTLEDVDEDGVGEIVIHGGGVARGYLGDDPGGFGISDDGRHYATGDLGRL